MAASLNVAFESIERIFSISCLTEIQKKAIGSVLDKKDVFVCTKTGSGKSICYECLPVVLPSPTCVVIAPLNLLKQVKQIYFDSPSF